MQIYHCIAKNGQTKGLHIQYAPYLHVFDNPISTKGPWQTSTSGSFQGKKNVHVWKVHKETVTASGKSNKGLGKVGEKMF